MIRGFQSRMRDGERLLGTMITLPTAATAEIIAEAGFDWFFVDGEHGALETAEVMSILQAVGDRVACLVRVPSASEAPIKRMLDLGANGIIVPQVNTPQQAADVVGWSKYAPLGSRGVGLGRAHGYGVNFADYVATANDEVCVIIQAEHRLAVENIEEILAVPGIDGVQLGPYDLSASMNKMGQLDDPEVVSAIDRIMDACRQVNLPIGCFGLTADSVQTYIDRGSTLICAGVDTLFLSKGAELMASKLKAGVK